MTVIEVFADVSCPFTHVGLRRLVARRDELGRTDVSLRVRAWPLEIVNGEPLDPDFVAEEVDDIRSQAAPDLFSGFDRSTFPRTSLPAMSLAAAAYGRDLATGERVSLAIRDLIFEKGIDVADLGALEELAAEHDLHFDPTDTRSVLADHAEGVERGVIGSPHFFTGVGGYFCPGLAVRRNEEGRLDVTADVAGFERFAAECFA